MDQYFAKDYTGGAFELFGTAHLAFIAFVVFCLVVLLPRLRGKDERYLRRFRITYTVIMVVNELAWHIWKAWIG